MRQCLFIAQCSGLCWTLVDASHAQKASNHICFFQLVRVDRTNGTIFGAFTAFDTPCPCYGNHTAILNFIVVGILAIEADLRNIRVTV